MLETLTDSRARGNAESVRLTEHAGRSPSEGPPLLRQVLADTAPFPREAIFLGLAEDGLPILLNLYDSAPGPLLITGDSGSGKTALLHTIARAAELTHPPSRLSYGVLTSAPGNWHRAEASHHRAGVFSLREATSGDFLHSLVEWAHQNKGNARSILLLLDDLESATETPPDVQQDLRWLLLRGPARHIWPIVTLDAARFETVGAWMNFFRTRIFGRISEVEVARALTVAEDARLESLAPGFQFVIRDADRWLKFVLPDLEESA